jgi:hypothetical protein
MMEVTMIERGSTTIWRVLAALLVVGLLLGAGAMVYRAGVDQGLAQAAIVQGEEGQGAVPGFRFYPGFYRPHFGFFPGFPLFGIFFFGLFFLFLLRWLFRPWGWGSRGHWHAHPHTHPWEDRPQGEPGPETQGQTGNPGSGQG